MKLLKRSGLTPAQAERALIAHPQLLADMRSKLSRKKRLRAAKVVRRYGATAKQAKKVVKGTPALAPLIFAAEGAAEGVGELGGLLADVISGLFLESRSERRTGVHRRFHAGPLGLMRDGVIQGG